MTGGGTGTHMRGESVTAQGIHAGGQSRGFLSMAAVKLYCLLLSARDVYESLKN